MVIRTGKEIRNFFVLLVLTVSVLGNTGVCYGKEQEQEPDGKVIMKKLDIRL